MPNTKLNREENMKKISSSVYSGVIAGALILGVPFVAQADNHQGMDVPKISSSVERTRESLGHGFLARRHNVLHRKMQRSLGKDE